MNTVDRQVSDYYVAVWGQPSRQATFTREAGSVSIYKWSKSQTNLGVTLYATIGAAGLGGTSDHCTEYILGLDPGIDDIASPMASLALYATDFRTHIGHGHTVPNDGPLWPGSRLSAFLIIQQSQTILAPLLLRNGNHVEFLQALPISTSERRFKVVHGVEALFDEWDREDIDFAESARRVLKF